MIILCAGSFVCSGGGECLVFGGELTIGSFLLFVITRRVLERVEMRKDHARKVIIRSSGLE